MSASSQPLCAQCGMLIDAHYLARARWALILGAIAACVTTLVAWMALSSEYHSLSVSRSMEPNEEVFADTRLALSAATCLALLLVGAAVWTRRNTLQAAIVTTLAVPAGAALAITLAPYHMWVDDLVMAPIGWSAAVAAGVTAWFWAYCARHIGQSDDVDNA